MMSSIQFELNLRSVGSLPTHEETAAQSRASLIARAAQNGFVSADLRAQLGLSAESLEAGRVRLLGGGRGIYQKTMTLRPGESFFRETSHDSGSTVHVCSINHRPHVTVTFKPRAHDDPERVLHSGPFTGRQNFAEGIPYGHFKLTIENRTDADLDVYVHLEDANEAECVLQ